MKRSVARSVSGDSFVEISPYGVGGPGGRFRRFGGYARGGVAMADAAMPASAPPPPQPLAKEAEADQGTAVAETLAVRSEAPTAEVPLRSNFAETAFWRPQLLTGADGSATIEFTVPDSVTSWRLWVSALTKSLASGFSERQVDSVKELMVRPYLPRFLREGDRADFKVVVNDAGDSPLSGTARLEIFDPATNQSLLGEFGLDASSSSRPFRVEPGKGVDLLFPLAAPHRVGPTAFKVTATAGNLSDGELRPLPVLPSRIRLAQSPS
ncbi:MAG: alpha-2-macroglobulin family protein [Thermoanaerobaculia bacterium]